MKTFAKLTLFVLLATASAFGQGVLTPGGIVKPTTGTDANIPTAGTMTGGAGTATCLDILGGITTVGCPSGFAGGNVPNPTSFGANTSFVGPRPYIDVSASAYGAAGDGGAEVTTGTISSGSASLVVANATGFVTGMGVHVDGAGASGDVLLAKINNIVGMTLTLSVTAGTNVTNAVVGDDDTLAIRGAMAAYCAGTNAGGGSIYFPPGSYIFSQPQSVNSTAYPFVPACATVHFLGGNGKYHGAAFTLSPQVTISGHCGPSPNAKAVFQIDYPNGSGTRFQNLIINGCNQAVEEQATNVYYENTFLNVGVTGLAKNTPLWIWDNFWTYFKGGGISTSGTTAIPMILFTGEACSGCYVGTGQFFLDGSTLAGGPVQYIQDAPQSGSPPAKFVFWNFEWESGATDFFIISDPGAYQFYSISSIDIRNFNIADNTDPDVAVIYYNVPNTTLSGVHIENTNATHAIRMTPTAHLDHYNIDGCDGGQCFSGAVITDGTLNAVGSGAAQTNGGFDFTEDGNALVGNQFITQPYSQYGPAIRVTKGGKPSATVGLGADAGLFFGNPNVQGMNAWMVPSTATPPNIDMSFAANYPPTGVAATSSNAGGSVAAGTWYLYVVSTTAANCTTPTGFSAPSNIVGPYTTTGAAGEFTLTWTPALTGVTPITGYCVFYTSTNAYNYSAYDSALVSGAGATGATITSLPNNPGGALPVTYTMVPEHHFTPTAGIFNGNATPKAGSNPPYMADCVAATTCTGTLGLSHLEADTMVRPNAVSLGANWSVTESNGGSNALVISSNTATAQTTTYGEETWTGQTFLADQFSRATISAIANGGSDNVEVIVRGSGTATRTNYQLVCGGNNSFIKKVLAGTFTTLIGGGTGCVAGNVIELDVVGSGPVYLSAFINGVQVLSASDNSSPITSGQPGIGVYNVSDALTGWVGGSLAPGNGNQSLAGQQNTFPKEQSFPGGVNASQFVGNGSVPLDMAPETNDAGGTTTTNVVKMTATGTYVNATTSDTVTPTFVEGAPVSSQGLTVCAAGTTGSGCIVMFGDPNCLFDAGGAVANHWLVTSTTVAGACHDSGTATTSAPPSGVWIAGVTSATVAANGTGKVHIFGGFYSGTGGGTPTLSNPTITPAPGAVSSPLTFTLNCTSCDTIFYTTDGMTPTTLSNGVAPGGTDSASFASTLTVKALAQGSGKNNSGITTNNYTLSGGSTATIVQAFPPVIGATLNGTVTSTIPTGSTLVMFGVNEGSTTGLSGTDSCGDSFGGAVDASDGGEGVGMVFVRTTCQLVSGVGTVSMTGIGSGVQIVYAISPSLASPEDQTPTSAVMSNTSSWAVPALAATANANDLCITGSATGSSGTMTHGTGWTDSPGSNNVSNGDGRTFYSEYLIYTTSGQTPAAAQSSSGNTYGGMIQACFKSF